MTVTRVHVLWEQLAGWPGACSHIRLLLPLNHPGNAGRLAVSQGLDYAPADVVVVERTWNGRPSDAEALVARVRRDGARLVYATDDDLIGLHRSDSEDKGYVNGGRAAVAELLARSADRVIVSTPELARRLAGLNRDVVVVPNALDERLLAPVEARERLRTGRLVIGYMGTATHDADLLMVAQALRVVMGRRPGAVGLELVGVLADSRVLGAFDGLPVRVVKAGDSMDYAAFMRWMSARLRWDVAIAPLRDTQFTRCKSDIKFLDYSALGFPGVYSQVAPYAATVRHLHNGYLADDSPSAWVEGLERLLGDQALRTKLARNARRYVLAKRTLRRCAGAWADALMPPVGGPGIERPTPTPQRILVVVPGTVNYFYDQAGRRVAEALRESGHEAEVRPVAELDATISGTWDCSLLVNPAELVAACGSRGAVTKTVGRLKERSRRTAALLLESVRTHWFMASAGLCAEAGIEELLDLGFQNQYADLPAKCLDRSGGFPRYRFVFNGLTRSEWRSLRDLPGEEDRPIPWAIVGHLSCERASMVDDLVGGPMPDGLVYLPRLSPVTSNGPHLNDEQFGAVLRRARYQVWCSHHEHFYLESERFRHSLLAGGVPLKVLLHPRGGALRHPFEDFLVERDRAVERLAEMDFRTERRRFVREFRGLPGLSAALSEAMGLEPVRLPAAPRADAAGEVARV